MKRVALLMLTVFAVGCHTGTPASTPSVATTELAGIWNVTGTGKTPTASATGTFKVNLVASQCSVTTPLGVISVAGTACFIANNNSGIGSISGGSISPVMKSLGQGILVGVAADPVPDNATINMVFVSSSSGGKTFQEFTGTAAISAGKMTGIGACSTASTASCTGASATFTATHQ